MGLKRIGVILAAAMLFLVTGCGTAKPAENAVAQKPKIKVVAAENFYGEVAQAVGGDRVEVTSILTNPEQDPHDYEPTADAAKVVADGKVIVYTGIGYDDWMEKLLKADSGGGSKVVVAVGSDLLGKKDGDNPHVWYDPSTMPRLAQKLADDLSRIDPDNAQKFQKQANDYVSTLEPLTAKVAKLKQSTAVNIDVSEPVFGYMAAALNLKINDPTFAKAIEEENDPTATDFGQVQSDIKDKKIKFFVYNIQTKSPTVDKIIKMAEDNGIPVVKVTETEPAGKNYIQWMTEQLDQVERILNI